MPRDASLSSSYTSDRCQFLSPRGLAEFNLISIKVLLLSNYIQPKPRPRCDFSPRLFSDVLPLGILEGVVQLRGPPLNPSVIFIRNVMYGRGYPGSLYWASMTPRGTRFSKRRRNCRCDTKSASDWRKILLGKWLVETSHCYPRKLTYFP